MLASIVTKTIERIEHTMISTIIPQTNLSSFSYYFGSSASLISFDVLPMTVRAYHRSIQKLMYCKGCLASHVSNFLDAIIKSRPQQFRVIPKTLPLTPLMLLIGLTLSHMPIVAAPTIAERNEDKNCPIKLLNYWQKLTA